MRNGLLVSMVMAAFASGPGCSGPENKRIIYPSTPPADWDSSAGVSPAAAVAWSFDDDPVGALPAGWRGAETRSAGAPAAWAVIADPSAASPPNLLAITETQNTGGTYNLALIERTSFQDLEVSVKVRALAGREDQGGGLIWRCQDADNYYICRWNPLETNFRVYKVVAGKRQQIASADTTADANQWHTVRAVMIGRHIECYLDGEKLLEGDDDAISTAGMIGLWTKADAATGFDDLSVRPAGGPNPSSR